MQDTERLIQCSYLLSLGGGSQRRLSSFCRCCELRVSQRSGGFTLDLPRGHVLLCLGKYYKEIQGARQEHDSQRRQDVPVIRGFQDSRDASSRKGQGQRDEWALSIKGLPYCVP